jgi:hypothetical protein
MRSLLYRRYSFRPSRPANGVNIDVKAGAKQLINRSYDDFLLELDHETPSFTAEKQAKIHTRFGKCGKYPQDEIALREKQKHCS